MHGFHTGIHLLVWLKLEFQFSTQFLYQVMYPEYVPRSDPSNRRLYEHLHDIYVSDTARNQTHNLFRPSVQPIPLGHSISVI